MFRETLALGGSYLSIYVLGMMVGIDYDAVIKFISKKICVILLFWLASMGLACNTFWAAVGKVEIIGLDSIIEYTINPPNFSVTLYAVMTMTLFGYLFGYTNFFAGIKPITNMVRVMGKYSLDIYLWHILCQHLCVRLNMAFQFNIWLLRIVAYVSMFGLPILGRYLYTMIKQKGNMLLQEDGIL